MSKYSVWEPFLAGKRSEPLGRTRRSPPAPVRSASSRAAHPRSESFLRLVYTRVAIRGHTGPQRPSGQLRAVLLPLRHAPHPPGDLFGRRRRELFDPPPFAPGARRFGTTDRG